MFILPPSNVEYTKLSSGTTVNIQTQNWETQLTLHSTYNGGKSEIKVSAKNRCCAGPKHLYDDSTFLHQVHISLFGDIGFYASSARSFFTHKLFQSPLKLWYICPPKQKWLSSICYQKYIYKRRRLSEKLHTFWKRKTFLKPSDFLFRWKVLPTKSVNISVYYCINN